MPVVHRCTVYCGDGEELFRLDGVCVVAVADAACQKAHKEYPRRLLGTLQWKFEKIYPNRADAAFVAPSTDVQLESWSRYVAKQQNTGVQV